MMESPNVVLGALALSGIALSLSLLGVGSWFVIRVRSSAARILGGLAVVCGAAVLGTIGWWSYQVAPGRSGIVTSGTAPDGREYCVVQTFQVLSEPYHVSLYVRDDLRIWRGYYLQHQDFGWRSARVEVNGDRAVVERNGERFKEIELAADPAEPEVIRPGAYMELRALSPDLSAAEVARLHNTKFGH